jgi:hypothetical protein
MGAGSLKGRQLTPAEVIQAVSRHATGVPIALIADQLGVPDEIVKTAIDKAKAARAARNGATLPVAAPATSKAAASRDAEQPEPAPDNPEPEPGEASPVDPEPEKPNVDPADLLSYEELAEWADDAGLQRAATLAERMRSAAEELRAMLHRRDEIEMRKSVVEVLERQLQTARAELASVASPKRTVHPGNGGSPTAEIRAWAVAQGYEVQVRGILPAQILAAFQAAHS